MKQNMDTAEKRINTLIAQKGKEISAIQDSIAKAEASADEARKRMIEATTNGDGQTYSGAKDQLRTAEDVIEMQRIRLDNLENNPMISPEEYNELSAAIQKSMTETVDKDIEEIKKIYAQLNRILDKEEAELTRCNNLLSTLQKDIMVENLSSGGVIRQELKYQKENTNIRKIVNITNPHDLSNKAYL